MAKQILMPKQGNSVESCIILEWKIKEGDSIATGDVICEVETDKATIEVEATAEGTVLKLLYSADDDVPVQVPIAIVGEPGEDISSLVSGDEAPAAEEEPETPVPDDRIAIAQASPASSSPIPAGAGFASPRAKMLAAKRGIDASVLTGSGPKGRVIERDVAAAEAGRAPLTPTARELMAKEQLNAPESGSGIGGRVVAADLLTSRSQQLDEAQVETVTSALGFPGPVVKTPVRSVRKITAQRMRESLAVSAQLTLNSAADATALKALRARLKQSDPKLGLNNITINDLVLYAVAKTLKEYPSINSHFLGDTIVEFEHVHLGCAVDTPKGLMVPVIRYADLMSLKALSETAKGLISNSLEGKAAPEDLQGGTFTVTNLGALGIDSFTPVLNVPETAILGVCTIQQRPVETPSGVQFVPYLGLSLTFDHQAFDGAPAARFLKALSENIKNIDLLMAR